TANRERLSHVHASTAPTDPRRAAPHPIPRCVPGILTLEDTPTAAVWTVWLRSLGCCVGLCRRTLVWSLCPPLSGSQQEATAEQREACAPKHLAFHHFEAVDVPLDRAGTPGQGDPSFDRLIVVAQPLGEALQGLQRTRRRALEPRIELCWLPLADQESEVLGEIDGLGDLGRLRVELLELVGLGLRALSLTPQDQPRRPTRCQGLGDRLRHHR